MKMSIKNPRFRPFSRPFVPAVLTAAVLAACGGSDGDSAAPNTKPSYLGTISDTTYDGASNDLLTAGLGATGMAAAAPPAYADPLKPTAAELRRTAIHTNYRAMLDMTAAGGYGSLYGPNVDAQGNVTASEGKVAGTEYIAFADDGSGRQNVTLMVQVPASFNPAKPCVITATASGSRGVYGGISTGEWGLKRGCAVAYSDKGTGGAPHDLMNDTVPLIDGTRTTATVAGKNAAFNAGLSAAELVAFNAATPHRFAFKHAHSGQNSEKDWGKTTLQAVEFAYYVLNERFGTLDGSQRLKTLTPANTIVIASSISNGGGAAIAAAEQDTQGLISGVAVSEPAVEMPANPGVTVQRGGAIIPPRSRARRSTGHPRGGRRRTRPALPDTAPAGSARTLRVRRRAARRPHNGCGRAGSAPGRARCARVRAARRGRTRDGAAPSSTWGQGQDQSPARCRRAAMEIPSTLRVRMTASATAS